MKAQLPGGGNPLARLSGWYERPVETWMPDAAWVSWLQEVDTWQADLDDLLRIRPEGQVVRLTEP